MTSGHWHQKKTVEFNEIYGSVHTCIDKNVEKLGIFRHNFTELPMTLMISVVLHI